MRTRRAFITALLSGAALALSLPAGASLGAKTAPPPLPAALGKTAQAKSFRFSFALTFKGGGTALPGGTPLTLRGQGGIDTRSQSAQLRVDLGALAGLLAGASGGPQVPSAIDVVVARSVFYARLPALAEQVKPGAEWIKVDPRTLPAGTTGGANVGQLAQVSPAQLLAAARRSIKTKRLGSATVRGVRTTRYRTTVDLARLAAALPKPERAGFLSSLRQLGLKTLPIDAWVDGSGYVRRLSTAFAVKAQGTPSSVRVTVDLYDFNKPVRVTVPPQEKTADAGQLLGQLLGGLVGKGTTGP